MSREPWRNIHPLAGVLAVLLVAAGAPSHQPTSRSDAQIRQILVGTWITPPDSPDYRRDVAGELEFYPDGTYESRFYSDNQCARLLREGTFYWKVENKILYTWQPRSPEPSDIAKDVITDIEKNRFAGDAIDGPYVRVRGELCPNAKFKENARSSHGTDEKPVPKSGRN